MKVHFQPRHIRERGYILLVLMLFVALLAIGMLTMVERIDSQIKRDREEELIHRGVQYSRAVRRYFKKFGRYPTRIEDLESTNNMRFLRKRYKDPVTGKDFKPLRMTDVQMSFGPATANGLPTGLGANIAAQQQGAQGAVIPVTVVSNSSVTGATSQTSDSGGQGDTSQSDQAVVAPAATQSSPAQPATFAGPGPQVFGGGAIVGVASVSKDKTIREFNKKDHYNQWQFIYDPTTDRGGLLMTPNQPPLQGAVQVNQQPQQNGPPPPQNPGPGGNPVQPQSLPPDQ